VFFRYFLAIPLFIVAALYGIGALFATLGAWFAILFTGRYPEGLYNYNAGFVRFASRLNAYFLLQTDKYPPFGMGEEPGYPIQVTVGPAKESYSRAKAFFRFLLAIPVYVIEYVLLLISEVVSFAAWFYQLFTGKQAPGLHNGLNLGLSYYAKSMGYFLLLTEDWPPMGDDTAAAPSSLPPTPPPLTTTPEAPVATQATDPPPPAGV
jgi:hypothetical protein